MGENYNLYDTDNHIQEYGLSFKSLYLLYSSNWMFCKFLHRSLPYLLLIYFLSTFWFSLLLLRGYFFPHYILYMACGNTAVTGFVSTKLKNSVVTSISQLSTLKKSERIMSSANTDSVTSSFSIFYLFLYDTDLDI